MTLNGKTVFITGGSSGMGLAVAAAVVEAGGSVCIASRSAKKLESAKNRIGKNVQTFGLDVTSEEAVKAIFEKVDLFDHLVTCAAGTYLGPFLESDVAWVRAYFESKFWGQYYTVKHAYKKINTGGSIVLFSGAANKKATPNMTASASINGAIEGLAMTLAQELAPIRVNVVSPGVIDTELHDILPKEEKDGLFGFVSQTLPIARVGLPEDAVKAVMYLLQAEYATGTVASVDGGYSAI
jgi:NAD(P)-dependent dehydrogenase (short-subunit alcohol dehydrogenase family)